MKQQWSQPRTSHLIVTARIVLVVCLSALALFVLAGCGDSAQEEQTSAPTARIRNTQPLAAAPTLPIQSTLAPADTPTPIDSQAAQVTVIDAANLRSGPGVDYERVGSAAAGEVLQVIGRNAEGDWYQLASGAWIAAFLVDGAPAMLPVVAAAPTMLPVVAAAPTGAPAALAEAVRPANNVPAGAVAARLTSVVDGDTIEVTIGDRQERLRYIDIDTPERGQPGYRTAASADIATVTGLVHWLVNQVARA